MCARLTADAARAWLTIGVDRLATARDRVDELNVFPVPDGDTGTNLLFTLRAARDEAEREAGNPADTLSAAARGALGQARGNSGAILAQMLAAFATASRESEGDLDGEWLAIALGRGARAMRLAVAEPVEGTILTVADHAARKAAQVAQADAGAVATRAWRAARKALGRTSDQLPVLARAGVVDAGACGYVIVMAALAQALTGARPDAAGWLPPARVPEAAGAPRHEPSQPATELVFVLDGVPGGGRDVLYRVLGPLGVSLTIARDGAAVSVHIHCDDPDLVVSDALGALPDARLRSERRAELLGGGLGSSLGDASGTPTQVTPAHHVSP